MSELPLRSAADFVLMCAFAAVAGALLVGGAVVGVYLIRGAFAAPENADAATR